MNLIPLDEDVVFQSDVTESRRRMQRGLPPPMTKADLVWENVERQQFAHHPMKTKIRSKTHIVKKTTDAHGNARFADVMTPETEQEQERRRLRGFGGFGGGLSTSGSFSLGGGGGW
mmetsp:Transcript_22736/g.40564  ORF Transcript_22736/g.40564 Transcript_22736/m.40564 type:complete len:116 (+) Transcript_22736:105-452(+)